MREITTYTEFWPYYLREHSHPATRGWHYVGTGLALLTLFLITLSGKWLLLPLALICGYFFAWVSHGLIENRMLFCFLTGQMGRELDKAGVARP